MGSWRRVQAPARSRRSTSHASPWRYHVPQAVLLALLCMLTDSAVGGSPLWGDGWLRRGLSGKGGAWVVALADNLCHGVVAALTWCFAANGWHRAQARLRAQRHRQRQRGGGGVTSGGGVTGGGLAVSPGMTSDSDGPGGISGTSVSLSTAGGAVTAAGGSGDAVAAIAVDVEAGAPLLGSDGASAAAAASAVAEETLAELSSVHGTSTRSRGTRLTRWFNSTGAALVAPLFPGVPRWEGLAAAMAACILDADHFLMAWSIDIADATSLGHRPFGHAVLAIVVVAFVAAMAAGLWVRFRNRRLASVPKGAAASIASARQHIPSALRAMLLVACAMGTHQLRDSYRRGLWLYPLGSTPPVPYTVYIAITAAVPLLVRTVAEAVVARAIGKSA